MSIDGINNLDEDRVVGVLQFTAPQTANSIGRSLSIEKNRVQAILYDLEKRQKVRHLDGTPPLWITEASRVNEAPKEQSAPLDIDCILRLIENSNTGLKTSELCKQLNSQKAEMNKILYSLEREMKITRIVISPPTWKMKLDKDSNGNCSSKSQMETVHQSIEYDSQKEKTRIEMNLAESDSCACTIHSKSTFDQDTNWGSSCADAVWKKFNELNPEASSGKEALVLAGFVLREKNDEPRVIAIGTGNKMLTGNNFSLKGITINDSHAEIVARRSLLRWLYMQLETAGSEGSFAESNSTDARTCSKDELPFNLLPFELWLYISQAPCGDAAVFSQTDNNESSYEPIWSNDSHGKLRNKKEESRGTIPSLVEKVQSVDGQVFGEAAMCHSCSDKLAKWSVLGVQGALLSRLIPPVILKGVVIGDAFSYDHACRALCCRSARAFKQKFSAMPNPFKINHLRISQDKSIKSRHQVLEKSKKIKKNAKSINWAEFDNSVEVTNSTTGQLIDSNPTHSRITHSRISKRAFFSLFCGYMPRADQKTYFDNKAEATLYQLSKKNWLDAMIFAEVGHWISKPREFQNFRI